MMGNFQEKILMHNILSELFDFSFAKRVKSEQTSYYAAPTVANAFNWGQYDSDLKLMELADGKSIGTVYELSAIPTEGEDEDFIRDLRLQFSEIFSDVFPRYDDYQCPWILSFYVSDDVGLDEALETMDLYIDERARNQPYTKLYLNWWKRHCKAMTDYEGLFIDPMTGLAAKGCTRRLRVVLYRNINKKAVFTGAKDAYEELENICIAIESNFRTAKLRFQRYDESQFHRWMTKWLSPKPTGYSSANEYLKANPLPPDSDKTLAFDLTQAVFNSTPISDDEEGTWEFDGELHKFIPILGFKRMPADGLLTAEHRDGKGANATYIAAFDKFPEGSVFMMTVVLQNEAQVMKRVDRIEQRAKKSITTDAEVSVEEAAIIKLMINDKNFLFPTAMGLYVKSADKNNLRLTVAHAFQLLSSLGFNPLKTNKDLVGSDSYLRFLPFNYNFELDRRSLFRSRFCSLKQIAATFPAYGRTQGTGHPGYSAFNRQMEMVMFDLINDRENNAHALTFGTTGSGKSAFNISMLMQMMAMKFPRMVFVDAGASLRQMVNLWQALGIKTNIIDIQLVSKPPPYSLNPLANTKAMLQQIYKMEQLKKSLLDYDNELEEKVNELTKSASEAELNTDFGERDFLVDFVAAAILMITGADKKELEALTRQDRYFILEGIKRGAKNSVAAGYQEMIPSDLANAFSELSKLANTSDIAKRYSILEHGLRTFVEAPLNAMYFDQRGKSLPDVDVTWLELGVFKDDREENEAPRALVFITTMNNTMTMAEKYKSEGRPTIFFGDECHIVTKKPITAACVVQCAKMSRKVNLWIWLATQNVKDFPDDAKKIVSMMEYLFVLYCDVKEREEILRFRELTEGQQRMIGSLKKAKGKYMENVMICNLGSYLFRNIPPREVLALAGTDSEENHLRSKLSQEFDCSEVEASLLMAQKYRGEKYDVEKIREEICAVL